MLVEQKKINELIPYVNNARTHDDQQIMQLASSIKDFGFNNPILIDKQNGIIAGHGRLEAARKLGLDTVPTIKLEHLTDAQRKAFILADNRIAMNSGWNTELLALELKDLEDINIDLEMLGFDAKELAALLEPEQVEGNTDEDAVPDVPDEPTTKLGDIYKLGNHRLMCGDSTSITDVDKLLDGTKIDLIFTDPPYNVAFNGRSGKHDVIKNDNLTKEQFDTFITETCNTIESINAKAYYIWCNWSFYGILQNKLEYKTCIVWAKNVFGMGVGYRHQHEFCLFNGKIDDHIKNESDLWEVKKDTNYIHPTQKPVGLAVRAFSNHITYTNVLDLFGGSGSTLIAAEKTGRNSFVMELDPKYCDVIVKRWEDFTGKKAELL